MKTFLKVESKDKPKLKEINYSTLYIRTNIHKELREDEEFFVYDEIQYEGNEIIEYIESKQIQSEQLITEQDLNLIETNERLRELNLMVTELDLRLLESEGEKING